MNIVNHKCHGKTDQRGKRGTEVAGRRHRCEKISTQRESYIERHTDSKMDTYTETHIERQQETEDAPRSSRERIKEEASGGKKHIKKNTDTIHSYTDTH